MPYFYIFLWDGENDLHIAAHGVAVEEFEHVILNDISVAPGTSSNRFVAFGYTPQGRKLACVDEVIDDVYCDPVTAFDVR